MRCLCLSAQLLYYMAWQEVKPTLKFGFQVYRQFFCEEGF